MIESRRFKWLQLPTQCTWCGETQDGRLRLTIGNVLRAIMASLSYLVPDVGLLEGLPFKWSFRCRYCGRSFREEAHDRFRAQMSQAYCNECGYDLRGSPSEHCPECGRARGR